MLAILPLVDRLDGHVETRLVELVEAGGIADGRSLAGRRQQPRLSEVGQVMAEGRGGHAQLGLDLARWSSFHGPLHHGPDHREAAWMAQGHQLLGDVLEGGV